jgi:beta-lactamase class A
MLQYSDNNATNSLISFLGMDKINRTCNEHGFSSVKLERQIILVDSDLDNFISAQDAVGMLSDLYSERSSIGKSFLESYMVIKDRIDRSGLGRNMPESYLFLNHNGITADKYNEVAIVSDGTNTYIISVLCNSGDPDSFQGVATSWADLARQRLL